MLPVAAVTNTFALLGQRGTGKSNKAVANVEDMVDQGGHVVVLDPVGAWYGITRAGEGPGLPGIIIGGEHGDVPLEETAGALLAEFVAERHYPIVVIDMKLLRKGAQLRFMADFCENLFHLNREALHVVFEEADRAAPQQIGVRDINASRLLGAVEDIVKLGRSRGLGCTLITQRPATLNKNVLEVCENLILFRLLGPNDRKAARSWIAANGDDTQLKVVMDSLASMGLGEHWFWSPAWLKVLEHTTARHRRSFDSSATPEVGRQTQELTERAPVDLDALRAAMAATVAAPGKEREPVNRQLQQLQNERDEWRDLARLLQGQLDALSKRIASAIATLNGEPNGRDEQGTDAEAGSGAGGPGSEQSPSPPRRLPGGVPGVGAGRAARSVAPREPAPPRKEVGGVSGGARPGGVGKGEGASRQGAREGLDRSAGRRTEDMRDDEVEALVRKVAAELLGASNKVRVMPPAEVIRLAYQQRAVDKIMAQVEAIDHDGKEALYFMLGQEGQALQPGRIASGLGWNNIRAGNVLKALTEAGVVQQQRGGVGGGASYRPRLHEWVADELRPHSPEPHNIADVHEAVLGRIARDMAVLV